MPYFFGDLEGGPDCRELLTSIQVNLLKIIGPCHTVRRGLGFWGLGFRV